MSILSQSLVQVKFTYEAGRPQSQVLKRSFGTKYLLMLLDSEVSRNLIFNNALGPRALALLSLLVLGEWPCIKGGFKYMCVPAGFCTTYSLVPWVSSWDIRSFSSLATTYLLIECVNARLILFPFGRHVAVFLQGEWSEKQYFQPIMQSGDCFTSWKASNSVQHSPVWKLLWRASGL